MLGQALRVWTLPPYCECLYHPVLWANVSERPTAPLVRSSSLRPRVRSSWKHGSYVLGFGGAFWNATCIAVPPATQKGRILCKRCPPRAPLQA